MLEGEDSATEDWEAKGRGFEGRGELVGCGGLPWRGNRSH